MDRLPDRPGPLIPSPARFTAYSTARDLPHIVVDGAPLPSTVLTLSHWPNNESPPALRRDTSTATTFAYLDTPSLHQAVPWVTTNHFDEDGLFSMYAISQPEEALAHRDLLIAASFAGDFGIATQRDPSRLCFIVEGLADPVLSPLPPSLFAKPDRVAALYDGLLEALPAVLADLPAGASRYRALWAEEEAHLAASRLLLESGRVTIEEVPDLDLAIVRIPKDLPARPTRRYLTLQSGPIHPYAINTATRCSRLLKVQGDRCTFEYRYESWVQLATRRVPLRVRLDELRGRLNGLEPGGTGWMAEDPADVAPRLHRPDGSPTRLTLETILVELRRALTSAPVAWDPYDWQRGKCA